MADRLKSAFLRTAVATAAFAVPLLAAGAAQAAIAGGSPEHTVNRPDLVSATILSGATGGGGSVDYCFDKTLANIGAPTTTGANYKLGGYRSANSFAASSATVETAITSTPPDSCVRANFPSAAGDLQQYTIATVNALTVEANGGVSVASDGNNPSDSTVLTGSNSHNGTAGFTVAPGLLGVLPDSTTNTIQYIEDKNIVGSGVNGPVFGDFYFVDAAGNVCYGKAIAATSSNTVTVSFAGSVCTSGSVESVTNAVRGGEFAGAVVAASDTSVSNVDNEVVVPNPPNVGDPTGVTAKPDLTDVKLEANQSALDFTFNKEVSPAAPSVACPACGASEFFADMSTGDEVEGNAATIINISTTSTTLRVTFPNFGDYDEYVIGGSVNGDGVNFGGAVETGSGNGGVNVFNTPGFAPIDPPFGNAGAFSKGFTTAPDVLAAVGSKTTGVVTVLLDQRAFVDNPADISLFDDTGNSVATAPSGSVTLPAQAAGQQSITVQFLPGQVTAAANLGFAAGALASALGEPGVVMALDRAHAAPPPYYACQYCVDQFSVPQVVSLTVTSSIEHSLKAHQKSLSRKQLATRTARLKAASKARLSKMRQLAAKSKSKSKSKSKAASKK